MCLARAEFTFQSRTKTMKDEKWIVSDRDHLGGKPRVQGTRISVAFLLECLASGMSVPEIVDAYPTLSEDAAQGALRELAHEKEAAAA
jgi:uncharacterized protein (DUF433 family)